MEKRSNGLYLAYDRWKCIRGMFFWLVSWIFCSLNLKNSNFIRSKCTKLRFSCKVSKIKFFEFSQDKKVIPREQILQTLKKEYKISKIQKRSMTQCQKTLIQKSYGKISTKRSSPKVLLISYFEAFNFFSYLFSELVYLLFFKISLWLIFILHKFLLIFSVFQLYFYINPFFFSKILKTSLQTSSLMNQTNKNVNPTEQLLGQPIHGKEGLALHSHPWSYKTGPYMHSF